MKNRSKQFSRIRVNPCPAESFAYIFGSFKAENDEEISIFNETRVF